MRRTRQKQRSIHHKLTKNVTICLNLIDSYIATPITFRASTELSRPRLRAFVTIGTIGKPAVCGNTRAAVMAYNLLDSAASFLVVPDQE